MKPASVEYHKATSIADAVDVLSSTEDEEAKVLAGGQSLVPMLSMRLARPSVLVDINGLTDLDYIRRDGDWLSIGALTRSRAVEKSAAVRDAAPLLSEAMGFVGHATIRNRGTIGGSVAHADPAAEAPAVLCALDAELVITGPAGARTVGANDFFHGFLTTAVGPDEMLTEIRVPVLPAGTGCAVEELARRHGDFAMVAVFAAVTVGDDGRCTDARLALAGTNPTPVRAREAEAVLVGSGLTAETIAQAAQAAAGVTNSANDIHAPAEYRRDMASVLTRRALRRAASDANVVV
ncbi:FAD binding domain-containing protein [Pseudonocardia sp. H11422]|uniref:FAD binding domain-containing protein n=1 Tax=Pseudonocardia sp. H11422 TaxID=2835866 RepID=UPI001BDC9C10|nr:xanthine dehydrogenase family protein subunit M [Pseudonocardia sp. H11422]